MGIFRVTSERDVMERLQTNRRLYLQYLDMEEAWQKQFREICAGKKTWPLLYDAFFKRIFHPDIHPERLENFIGCLLKQKARIKGVLPLEDVMMDGQSLLVMDILVELKNGSLVLVEIQKIPYDFPAERASCYSADLLLRQYTRVKSRRGKQFQYSDLKKVYTIVFYEKSTEEFHKHKDWFVHYGKTTYDSGIELNFLQEFYLVALDVFKESSYAKSRKPKERLCGWLSLLSTEDTEEAEELCKSYPWLEEIYREMAQFSRNPEEVLHMFSEALRVMDQNLAKYTMKKQEAQIEEQKKVLEEQEKEIEQNRRELEQNKKEIEQSKREIEQTQNEIEKRNDEIEKKNDEIEKMKLEIAQLKQQLAANA